MMSGNNLDTAVTGVCVGLAENKSIAMCEFTYNNGTVAKNASNGEPLYLGFTSFAEMDTFIEALQKMKNKLIQGGDTVEGD